MVQIDPIFQPTRSVLALISAVGFVRAQAGQAKLPISAQLTDKLITISHFNDSTIIEHPSRVLETIKEGLQLLVKELPQTKMMQSVRVPDDVSSMRFVTSVEALANALRVIISALDELNAA